MIISDNSFVLQRRWVLYDRSALSNYNWSRDPDLFGFSVYILKCIYDILHILPLLLLLSCNCHCVLWNSCIICLYSKAQMLVNAQRKVAAYCHFRSFLPIWFLELLENSCLRTSSLAWQGLWLFSPMLDTVESHADLSYSWALPCHWFSQEELPHPEGLRISMGSTRGWMMTMLIANLQQLTYSAPILGLPHPMCLGKWRPSPVSSIGASLEAQQWHLSYSCFHDSNSLSAHSCSLILHRIHPKSAPWSIASTKIRVILGTLLWHHPPL